MLKWVGLILIALTGAGAGLYASAALARRKKCLECGIRLVDAVAAELRYQAPPLADLLVHVTAGDGLVPLGFLGPVMADVVAGKRPDDAWQRAVAADDSGLSPADKELFIRFGSGLGKSDVEGQLAHCAAYREQLTRQAAAAGEDVATKGRLYLSLGVIGGLALALLLL